MKKIKRELILHLRRIVVLFFDFLFDHNWFYRLLGWMNDWVFEIRTVFLMYPEQRKYALSFVYPSRLPKVKWSPFLAGFFVQNGKLGLMFAISATPADFRDPANEDGLRMMVQRMEKIRQLVGAPRRTFAGVLPGILYAKRLVKTAPEVEVTIEGVLRAIDIVKQREGIYATVPIIVLGGRGFIGRRLVKKLQEKGNQVIVVDKDDPWPDDLYGEVVIVVNTTLKGALLRYRSKMWSEMIIINEVYPPPKADDFSDIGCAIYHIKGAKAWALPPFPHAYQGGIPLCAAFLHTEMDILVDCLVARMPVTYPRLSSRRKQKKKEKVI